MADRGGGSGIIYALVAHRSKVLAECSIGQGNFTNITRRILEKLPQNDSKMTYVHNEYLFHYVISKEITFLCMAPESFGRRIPFSFLESIEKSFTGMYPDAKNAPRTTEFVATLKKQMEFYNKGDGDKVTKLRREIDEVKDVMVQNIDKLIDRGDSIDRLLVSTETLTTESAQFHKDSRSLRRAMCLKNAKLMAMIAIVVAVIIFVIVLMACGGFTFKDCKSSPPPPPPPPPTSKVL